MVIIEAYRCYASVNGNFNQRLNASDLLCKDIKRSNSEKEEYYIKFYNNVILLLIVNAIGMVLNILLNIFH
jgi:hypothetical protein